ncbi:uncharacterized protein LDX57_004967 [Aspergillus melleus]|uniref:uncharacterized protein n=1 Tax=Aspergillus melleus TaxID=138277 RepID=UPI001E8DBDC4|nr:uncharacterized protein LDX57_004967 [Aspergillus melleus]KAH8427254.1 hypothetical protein LDX57_004967 [Aspergillus melleus]
MTGTQGQSSVGSGNLYVDGDQRTAPQSEQGRPAYKQGQPGSHKNLDSKDERSIANKLASQEGKPDPGSYKNGVYDPEAELSKKNPTQPAVNHGNEPSKGAKIDRELQLEDEQRLKEKGIKK